MTRKNRIPLPKPEVTESGWAHHRGGLRAEDEDAILERAFSKDRSSTASPPESVAAEPTKVETADSSADKRSGAAFGVGSTDEAFGVGHTDEVYDLRYKIDELKNQLSERVVTFMDRLGVKLFGLTPAERYRSWADTTSLVTPWQERLALVVGNTQTRFTDFWWSTIGTWWDMLPPTLRPAIVERHLPRYRWCISSGSDEVFLSGVAHSAEKASEDARTVAAILKGVFEVMRRRPASVTPPVFSHVVYFENGTKAIPEINPEDGYTWKSYKAARVVSQVQAS